MRKKNGSKRFIYVRSNRKDNLIDINTITHIQGLSDFIIIKTNYGKKYLVCTTMKNAVSVLPENKFERIHRSFIVNQDCIEKRTKTRIIVVGQKIDIGITYRQAKMAA